MQTLGSENLPALLALTFPGSGSYDGHHAMRTCLHWKRIRNYPALNPPGPIPEPQKSRVRLSARESFLVHLLHFTGEETEAGRWRMKVMICPRCTGTGSPSQDWSPGSLVKGGSSSYSAEPESPKRQQEPGGREVRRRRNSWGCRPAAPAPRAPSGPSPSLRTVLPPAPPPDGRGCRPPPVPMATRAPGPAALASLPRRSPSGPKPSPAGSPEASAARGSSQHPRGQRPGLERQHSYYPCQHLGWLLGSS